jgi:hypothetical protein
LGVAILDRDEKRADPVQLGLQALGERHPSAGAAEGFQLSQRLGLERKDIALARDEDVRCFDRCEGLRLLVDHAETGLTGRDIGLAVRRLDVDKPLLGLDQLDELGFLDVDDGQAPFKPAADVEPLAVEVGAAENAPGDDDAIVDLARVAVDDAHLGAFDHDEPSLGQQARQVLHR